jgi:hypothetical protein
MPKFAQTFLVTIITEKPIKEIADRISARAWTMDGVCDVMCVEIPPVPPQDPAFDGIFVKTRDDQAAEQRRLGLVLKMQADLAKLEAEMTPAAAAPHQFPPL